MRERGRPLSACSAIVFWLRPMKASAHESILPWTLPLGDRRIPANSPWMLLRTRVAFPNRAPANGVAIAPSNPPAWTCRTSKVSLRLQRRRERWAQYARIAWCDGLSGSGSIQATGNSNDSPLLPADETFLSPRKEQDTPCPDSARANLTACLPAPLGSGGRNLWKIRERSGASLVGGRGVIVPGGVRGADGSWLSAAV